MPVNIKYKIYIITSIQCDRFVDFHNFFLSSFQFISNFLIINC